ncbi:MAG: hypothetical protein J1E82_09235 [Muribaculaceae bacterium]|nr:hypothetical protein [Muribaculaceae bacterium]
MKKNLLKLMAAGAVIAMAGTATAQAEDHNFTGSYTINGFYFGADGSVDMDEQPLVIDENNVVTQFAFYDLTDLVGLNITGNVSGNTFTFKSAMDLLIVAELPNGHYTVLGGYGYEEEYNGLPVEITYDETYDEYLLSDWAVWDYNPQNNEFEFVGSYMSFGLYRNDGEAGEAIDFEGTYYVTGYKTVYTDGVAGEPQLAEFEMTIQDDGDGGYEFTEIAGYEVGYTPKGWLGVYGMIYGKNILEIQGDMIDSSADGLKIACPNAEFDENYIVSLAFDDSNSGAMSNFGIWRTEDGNPVELLEVWTTLAFSTEGSTGIQTIEKADLDKESNEAPVYYNLQGVRVQNPSNGVYIMKQGNKTRKVVIRK